MTARDHWLDDLHPEAYRTLVEGVPAILYIDRPDELSTNLYTSPQVEPILGFTVEEWRSDPELWRQAAAPRRRRSGARDAPPVELDREPVPRRVPDPHEGRAHALDPRRGVARARRGRLDPVLARRDARHHRPEGSRGQAPVEPRGAPAHAAAAPRARPAAAARAGGGAPADRGRHPRRPDPGDERRRHAAADAARGSPTRSPRRRSARSSRRSPSAIERLRSLLFELRPTALDRDGLVPALRLYVEHTAKATGWTVEVHDELTRRARRRHGGAAVPDRAGGGRQRPQARRGDDRCGSRSSSAADGGDRPRDRRRRRVPPDLDSRAGARPPRARRRWSSARSSPAAGCGCSARRARGTTVECWLPVGHRRGRSRARRGRAERSRRDEPAVASAGSIARPVAGSK